MRVYKTTSEAYLDALRQVWFEPEFTSAPRGLPIKEITDYCFKVTSPSSDSIVTLDEARNKTIESYTEKEKILYDSGTNLVTDFAKASKFWNKIANPDGETINSAYGHLIWNKRSHGNPYFESLVGRNGTQALPNAAPMRTPWEWCVESLKADKDTRQAILRFSLPEHAWKGVKDFVCTLHGNFLIRNDKLYFSVTMRSNDLMKGTVYDVPWFCSLMDKMVEELKHTYPNLEKGSYTHIAHSMHIYEQDGDKVKKMIGIDL